MEEVIADKSLEWQQILEQAFSMLHCAKEAESDQALQQVSLLGCVGLKTGMVQEAQACFTELLAVDSAKGSAFCYLVCVKNMLMMASRMRKGELFTEWLLTAEERLSLTLQKVEQQQAMDFVVGYLFCLDISGNLRAEVESDLCVGNVRYASGYDISLFYSFER